MLLINSIWEEYFNNNHEGLGTTYERFILHKYFKKMKDIYSIQSVIEAPSFGMTGISGINSMWWAAQGIEVTISDNDSNRINLIKKVWQRVSLKANFVHCFENNDPLPFDNHSFDMGWNFAALRFVSNPKFYLEELARVCKKVIYICMPNKTNVFNLTHLSSGKSTNNESIKIKDIMRKLDWQISEHGYLDIPPWPDIAMKKEDLLKKIGLKSLAKKLQNSEENYMCILDYFSGKNKDIETDVLKYDFLENWPCVFQMLWAHQKYFIFVPVKK